LAISIPVAELETLARGWLLDGQIRQHSKATLSARTLLVEKLLWYLKQQEFEVCGIHELRSFLAYLNSGHESKEGRWGNDRLRKAPRPRTIATYFGNLRTLFRYLVEDGSLEASPMDNLRAPIARADQIQPFTAAQIQALLTAARKSRHARRDEAIILFLLDTGARATELCQLRLRHVDLASKSCRVLGKGNKHRVIYFGRDTTKALWTYLKAEPREADDALFQADRGTRAGEPLTRSGLLQLIERLGKAAKIEVTRCSPHTFRHTFAVEFLRAGGNTFALMTLLGHTCLDMTRKYAALAQADVENQHRQFSPADRLRRC
jgi:site-specific recombinase XerD